MYPTSRPPTPISPAGTSVSGPMCLYNSVMKLWQKRITSLSDLPFGSKSEPPLLPPIGRVVRLFLKICSNPRNFITDKLTLGWKRRPPLYGPIAELNWTRKPRFTWTFPASSTHGTRNIMIRSGSTSLSIRPASSYSGCFSTTGSRLSKTSSTACRNSFSFAQRLERSSYTFFRYAFVNAIFVPFFHSIFVLPLRSCSRGNGIGKRPDR